jgi:hypothetical protein
MKTAATILSLLLASCAAAPTSPPQEMSGVERANRVSLYLGQRNLDNDWDPVDDQGTVGLEYSHETPGGPIGFEFGVMGSQSKEHEGGFDIKGTTGEIYGGVRKSFGSDVIRGYVGAGVSYINAKIDVESVGDDDDSSLAGYVHGGVTADLSTSLYLGLDLRFLFASDLTIVGESTDADYGQLALVLGFAF